MKHKTQRNRRKIATRKGRKEGKKGNMEEKKRKVRIKNKKTFRAKKEGERTI
jgi:hypothetical protein